LTRGAFCFYPDLDDKKIATIKESTPGASELLQEAEKIVETREEREIMDARERYWHDQAAINSYIQKEYDELMRSVASGEITMKEAKAKFIRNSIAEILDIRFREPVETTLELLNRIDSIEALERLHKMILDHKDYESFLAELSKYDVKTRDVSKHTNDGVI